MKRKIVDAIIEQASDGNYSIYMDDDDMSYLVTGTGKTVEEAMGCFMDGYKDTKAYYAEVGKPFQEAIFVFKNAREEVIEKACNYLFSHMGLFVTFFDDDIVEDIERSEFIKKFRKEMEDKS